MNTSQKGPEKDYVVSGPLQVVCSWFQVTSGHFSSFQVDSAQAHSQGGPGGAGPPEFMRFGSVPPIKT